MTAGTDGTERMRRSSVADQCPVAKLRMELFRQSADVRGLSGVHEQEEYDPHPTQSRPSPGFTKACHYLFALRLAVTHSDVKS